MRLLEMLYIFTVAADAARRRNGRNSLELRNNRFWLLRGLDATPVFLEVIDPDQAQGVEYTHGAFGSKSKLPPFSMIRPQGSTGSASIDSAGVE